MRECACHVSGPNERHRWGLMSEVTGCSINENIAEVA